MRIRNKWEISFAGGIYHVTQRAPGKEKLFIEDDDYILFITLLKNTAEKYSLDIFSFCCMPNHVHLLLRTNDNNLTTAMKYLFERYAKCFNLKYQRKGHVFCGSFAAALCDSNDYFMTISLYIHLNPCAAAINYDPWLYQWSSINAYGENCGKTFIQRDYLLSMIDSDRQRSISFYQEMLETVRDIKIKKFIFENQDCAAYKRRVVEVLKRKETLHSIVSRIYNNFFGSRDILDVTTKPGRRIRDKNTLLKRRYVIQQLKAEGYTLTDIAVRLKITRQAVHLALNSK